MKFTVVGAGLQGRAVLHDLAANPDVRRIVAVDHDASTLAGAVSAALGTERVETELMDARDGPALAQILSGTDVVIEMLPADLQLCVARAALQARVHLVNCHYPGELPKLASDIAAAGLCFMPEAGLDPGLDLVLAARAMGELDATHELISYGAGFPEADAATGPTRYKATWSLEGVLRSYVRPARLLRDRVEEHITAEEIFEPEHIHHLEVPGVGTLEAYPNGDAITYAERLGIAPSIRTTGRYVLRWPGHAALWRQLVAMGLLRSEPLGGAVGSLSPLQLLARVLEPQLRYAPNERDVAVARVEARGVKDDALHQVVCQVVDRRDLATGLFAMNRTVGFTASIAAQLIASGQVTRAGVLSPACDLPPELFATELERRGIGVSLERDPWSQP